MAGVNLDRTLGLRRHFVDSPLKRADGTAVSGRLVSHPRHAFCVGRLGQYLLGALVEDNLSFIGGVYGTWPALVVK